MKKNQRFEERESTGLVETWALSLGFTPVMGVDEAGRGCIAGPVVAVATILPYPNTIKGLDDSKSLSPEIRKALSQKILKYAIAYGIGIVDAKEVDRDGILQSTFRAMRDAVQEAISSSGICPGIIIVDGKMTIPEIKILQKAWIKGDHYSLNCAASSILAKVTRDELMIEYDSQYPGYGFKVHKGYCTKEHLDAIERLGPCPIHRLSFNPLKSYRKPTEKVDDNLIFL